MRALARKFQAFCPDSWPGHSVRVLHRLKPVRRIRQIGSIFLELLEKSRDVWGDRLVLCLDGISAGAKPISAPKSGSRCEFGKRNAVRAADSTTEFWLELSRVRGDWPKPFPFVEEEMVLAELGVRSRPDSSSAGRAGLQARNVAMWMIWESCALSLSEIGELFGGLDYAAVAKMIHRTRLAHKPQAIENF